MIFPFPIMWLLLLRRLPIARSIAEILLNVELLDQNHENNRERRG